MPLQDMFGVVAPRQGLIFHVPQVCPSSAQMILLRSDITCTTGSCCSLTAKWARELQLSSEQQSDFELELLELPSAPTQQLAPLSSPLICFLLFPVHCFLFSPLLPSFFPIFLIFFPHLSLFPFLLFPPFLYFPYVAPCPLSPSYCPMPHLLLSGPLQLIAGDRIRGFLALSKCRFSSWVITQCQVAAVTGKGLLRLSSHFLHGALGKK